MLIIAFANQKGGVGKSAGAVNVAAALAEAGHRVLLMDLDAQRTATRWIGQTDFDEEEALRAFWLAGGNAPIQTSTFDVRGPENEAEGTMTVDVIPAGTQYSALDLELRSRVQIGTFQVLRKQLARLSGYDVCILDTAPGVGALTLNALAAASFVVAPLFPAAESLHGLSMIADTVDDVRQINPELKVGATYISYHRSQTNLTRDVREAAAHLFPDAALQAHIRVDVSVPRSYLAQKPVLISAAESRAAQDYRAVASEIAERIGLTNNAS